MQDVALLFVGKVHVLEPHLGRAIQLQGLRAGRIGNFALLVEQGEHLVQIGQALLDLSIQHTQEVQRDVQLDHEGIDHDKVAQRHVPLDHPGGRTPQNGHQRRADDELLTRIEHGERGLAFQAGLAQTFQCLVVAAGFKRLVVEVLDGFVVQQRIDGFGLAGGLHLVHVAADLHAPIGHLDGEHHV